MGNPAWGDTGEGDFIDAIRYMVEHGVNHVDTAVNYGGGESERIVGRAIKDFRDKLIITTKGGFVRKDGKMVKDCSRANMLRSCEESLKNLGLDYIDIYMVHQVDPTVPFGETMEALNTLKAQGKIRAHRAVQLYARADGGVPQIRGRGGGAAALLNGGTGARRRTSNGPRRTASAP